MTKSYVAAFFVACGFAIVSPLVAEEVTVDADAVVRYVESCRKPNGAFGPADQEYTDAAWNYPAWGTLNFLQVAVDREDELFQNGLGSPSGHGSNGHYQFFHHHVLRSALRRKLDVKHRHVAVVHQGFKVEYYASPFGTNPDLLFKAGGRPNLDLLDAESDTFYYYNLSSLYYLLAGLSVSGRYAAEPRPLVDYILRRQAANGGFTDDRTGNGPSDVEAHLAVTYQAVGALSFLGAAPPNSNRDGRFVIPNVDRIAGFVHACRAKNGGYRWNPQASLPSNEADVYYTRMALGVLQAIEAEPAETELTVSWLNSLQNSDGGFGDRPGWKSRLYSTYYAVRAFDHLGEPRRLINSKQVTRVTVEPIADDEFGIYQAQLKMPVVQPGDLAGLHKRGFNLLGLKSEKFEDAERLLAAIREQKLPMDVVLCPEMYPHRLTQLGGAVLNHVGNFTLDPRWTAEQKEVWRLADAAGRQYLPWVGYRDKVVKPLAAQGSLAYPEQDFELEYALISYGDDRSGATGYNAVLCGFNWPPRDFVRVFPWRERYVDRLVPIADIDAHGDLAKWSDQLDATRTLFLARGPTYADFQEAAAAGRVVTVIAQPEGVPSGASYYGPPAAVDYVRRRRAEWQWWK
jgi:prenyltransferase beta subunit